MPSKLYSNHEGPYIKVEHLVLFGLQTFRASVSATSFVVTVIGMITGLWVRFRILCNFRHGALVSDLQLAGGS